MPVSDFKVSVDIAGGIGTLRWDEQEVEVETLQRALSLASDDAILAHDLRRLQVELPEWDTAARVAVHRCGFRLYKEDWELPGGVVERLESPRDGGQRETLEELGIRVEFGQPLLVDWMPPYLGWSDAVEFIFDGGVLPPEVAAELGTDDREIRAIHWVEPADVPTHVTELSARRIALMLSGYRGLTEDGYPVAP